MKTLQRELHNYEIRNTQSDQNVTPNEQFLLKIVHKFNHYLDFQKASMNQRNDDQVHLKNHIDIPTQTQLMYQRQAFQDAKVVRLQQQISEMGLEYQCQVTQIESLQKINNSLSVQVMELEKKLIEAKTKNALSGSKFSHDLTRTPRTVNLDTQGSEGNRIVRKVDQSNAYMYS